LFRAGACRYASHDYLPEFLHPVSDVLCDGRMRAGYRADASQNGEVPVIEKVSTASEPDQSQSLAAAERRAEEVREQAQRELQAARTEANRLRTSARNRSAEMRTEALRERIELRAAAEKQLVRWREQAELEAAAIRAGATDEVGRVRAEAEGEAAAIVEAAELEAAETMARIETAVAGMIEDAHRLAAQIVDGAQLEAEGIVAEAGKRIGVLDSTARDLVTTIAEMKERFETRGSGVESDVVAEARSIVMDAEGDAVAVHEEEVVEPFEPDPEILAFIADADRPRRRWFQVFRRA